MRNYTCWSDLKAWRAHRAHGSADKMPPPFQRELKFCCTLILFLLVMSAVTRALGTLERNKNHQQFERTVAADPRAVVSACVVSGNLTVRGWDRNEVRARVTDAFQVDLTRIDQGKTQSATELALTGKGSRHTRSASCPPVGNVELDVPRGATVKLQSTNGAISVSDVARVDSNSQAGSTEVIKAHGETSLSTIGGEISVRDSTGSFKLHTVGGSIDARDLRPANPADAFDADTIGGEITLNRIQHARLKVNTVSGEVDYTGPVLRGGEYSFQSISGHLRLSLPPNSSFRVSGTLGRAGGFTNDFAPKDTLNGSNRGPTRQLNQTVGRGDASIVLSFFSGSIQIKKR